MVLDLPQQVGDCATAFESYYVVEDVTNYEAMNWLEAADLNKALGLKSWVWVVQGWGGAGLEANWKSCGHNHSGHIPHAGKRINDIHFVAGCTVVTATQAHQIIPHESIWQGLRITT